MRIRQHVEQTDRQEWRNVLQIVAMASAVENERSEHWNDNNGRNVCDVHLRNTTCGDQLFPLTWSAAGKFNFCQHSLSK